MENTVVNTAPVGQLKTNKGLLKLILLSLITFGIYPLVVMSAVSNDINIVASRYDGKKTMHFCLLTFIVAPITFGIAGLVWYNNISDRIGAELRRRGIDYSFGAGTFWGWGFLGSLLFGIGPLVYIHKLFKAVNLMNAHYNVNG
jgi:energy-converting hydrogenase Eha subunit C